MNEVQDEREQTVAELLEQGEIADAVIALDRVGAGEQSNLVRDLPADHAAELIDHVIDAAAAPILSGMSADNAAAILEHITSDHRADLIASLPDDAAAEVMACLQPQLAAEARDLLQYPSDSAGGLMTTELLRFDAESTVGDIIDDFGRNAAIYRDFEVQYSFVCRDGRLVGVLPLRDLLLSNGDTPVSSIMVADPLFVAASTPIDDLENVFDNHRFLAIPVVDDDKTLLGVVQRSAVESALSEQQRSDYLKSQGIVGGEEIRSLPMLDRSRRRISWLSINILLNVCAASVIANFQETLQSVIALAVFLPIISDMSGCSGNQAVAVSMRELSLGLVRPRDMFRVLFKELTVGMLNGFVLGLLVATAAVCWKGEIMLGVVVGTALCINTIIAVCFGGVVPLLLKRFSVDQL